MSIPTDRLREIADGAMGIGAPLVLTQAEQVEVCTELLALRDATSLPGYTRLVDERDAARAELAALRGRDAEPFDWDGVPTVEEWIAENLREREPRAGSAMVELHPDEVVADRGESRRVAGWLKDLLAELAAVKRQRDELVKACSAKDDLLACYRIGKRPSEALFKRLDKAKEVLDNIAAEQPKPEVQP